MDRIIFVTGKQGAGKSTLSRKITARLKASCICVDSILTEGAAAKPDHFGSSTTEWSKWENLVAADLRACIIHGLQSQRHKMDVGRPDLIIDGAILCNDWFREPLREEILGVLALHQQFSHSADVCIYLAVSNETIYRRIHDRADSSNCKSRKDEAVQYSTVDKVAEAHRNFDAVIKSSRGGWHHVETDVEAFRALGLA